VLTWNIHHGVGTDGKYNIDRIATWIVKTGANVVSLNEVERYTGWGNEDQPARFAALLKAKTGVTWYYNFAQATGATNGQGNLLLSSFPLESSGDHLLSASRSVARIAIIVNGIRVNVFSTHLDSSSQSTRVTQMKQLSSWAATYPEQRIVAGDFNCYGTWIDTMKLAYTDAWALAVSKGLQVTYSANPSGYTKSNRIDYVFHSKTATRLYLTRMQIYDTRDSSGVMPSDHRPIMATYSVK
jgi:endonuclease/exonuclease/phosphatase family metal-dependent hydrolase